MPVRRGDASGLPDALGKGRAYQSRADQSGVLMRESEPIHSESGALLFLRGAIPAARQVRWGRAAVHALTGR